MKYLYQNKYWEINKEYDIDQILYLIIDRPNYISSYNDFVWLNNNHQQHRNYDLPSFVCFYNDGTCGFTWHKNSKYHRENNKPAILQKNGDKSYYINDKFIKNEEHSK